jgi:GT2 family glycosyltransferase
MNMIHLIVRKFRTAARMISGIVNRLLDVGWRGASLYRCSLDLTGHVFDTAWYMMTYPYPKLTKATAASHFFRYGLNEGRQARFFDVRWYLNASPDINPILTDAYLHYTRYGLEEGRSARYFYVHASVYTPPPRNYGDWLASYDTDASRQAIAKVARVSEFKPMVSVVVTPEETVLTAEGLRRSLASLCSQVFPHFEAIVVLPTDVGLDVRRVVAELDGRFRILEIEQTGTAALKAATAVASLDFIAILPAGARLHPEALYWLAFYRNKGDDDPILYYGDDDEGDVDDVRKSPHFRPRFNYELLLSHNMFGAFFPVRRDILLSAELGDYVVWADALYDLAMRLVETERPERFVHVPYILCHLAEGGKRQHSIDVVAAHLQRAGKAASVGPVPGLESHVRVRFALPNPPPMVSILIPTRDRVDLLKTCIGSLVEKTTYCNYEIIIIDNGSVEAETLAYFASFDLPNLRVIRDDRPFNYSALNNAAAKMAEGAFLCLMNNDIEVLTLDWLEDMMSFAIQPDVGCVGARLLYPDGRIQHAGVLLGYHGVAGHMHKLLDGHETGHDHRAVLHQSVSAVTAACMLVNKRIYEEVGGMDEALAVAFNDVDFCLKVRNAGYRNVYTPYAEMIHHESATRGVDRTRKQRKRGEKEIAIIKARYGAILLDDPAYNPNLTLFAEDFSLAFPPRSERYSPQ